MVGGEETEGLEAMETPAVDPRVELAKDRTSLAKLRTALALDRTMLAWIRTALTMATFGFGTVGFFRSLRAASPTPENIRLHQSAITFGVTLIVMGVSSIVLSGGAYWFALRRLRHDRAPALNPWPLSITVGLLLAILGSAALWALLAR
jgi:putative membrane protein